VYTQNAEGTLDDDFVGRTVNTITIPDAKNVVVALNPIVYTLTQTLTNVSSSNIATSLLSGETFETTLTADSYYEMSSVTVTMGGSDITSTAYDASTGKVTIAEPSGNVVITATATSIPTYTITNTLTNVTNSNTATSVNENDSYTATLTADTGYTLDSVTVTMGGTDVTSTVYADGVISITSVTGNVVITASATQN
jgi:adhesin/invasin